MMGPSDSFIHPTSVIDPGAKIGRGTKIWHFCHVCEGAVIGSNCVLGQNVYVSGRARIGNNVKIQNNVSVYDGVEIEDDVFCGPSMVFTNVKTPRAEVSRRDAFERTLVCRGAMIGANATIICGTTLGRHCFIGAGAVVTRDVPPFALMVGVPAERDGWSCRCGAKLRKRKPLYVCPRCAAEYEKRDSELTELKA